MKIFVCLANQVGVAAKLISFGLNGRMSPRPSSSNVKWSQTPITFFLFENNDLTTGLQKGVCHYLTFRWYEAKTEVKSKISITGVDTFLLSSAPESIFFFWTKLVIVEITNHLISTWGVNFKLRTIAGKGLLGLLSVYKACLHDFVAPQFVCLFVKSISIPIQSETNAAGTNVQSRSKVINMTRVIHS